MEISERLIRKAAREVEADHDDAWVERFQESRVGSFVQNLQVTDAGLRPARWRSPDRPASVGAVFPPDEIEPLRIDHKLHLPNV